MADENPAAGAALRGGSGPRSGRWEGAAAAAPDFTPARAAPLAGVAMRIAEAGAAPACAPAFELAVLDRDGGTAVVLGRYAEEDVVAEWRRLGQASGLPLMIENPDGSLCAPYPQIGPLALGEIRARRRHGLLSGRRPRFLTRRKTGRPQQRPLVHREREIVAGRG